MTVYLLWRDRHELQGIYSTADGAKRDAEHVYGPVKWEGGNFAGGSESGRTLYGRQIVVVSPHEVHD